MNSAVTGFMLDMHPDVFCTVFGCVEELRAFPERLWLGGKRSRLEPVYFNRIMKARKALANIKWMDAGQYTMATTANPDEVDSSVGRVELAVALDRVAKALDDFAIAIHSTWGTERAAVEKMIEAIGRAQMEAYPAEMLSEI